MNFNNTLKYSVLKEHDGACYLYFDPTQGYKRREKLFFKVSLKFLDRSLYNEKVTSIVRSVLKYQWKGSHLRFKRLNPQGHHPDEYYYLFEVSYK